MGQRVCLIVDDDSVIRGYLTTVLQRTGWKCLEAASAPDGRRMVESLHGALDLVLTDIEMPGEINGIALARWIRETFPGVPVILVSGSGEVPPAEFPLVSKPCKPETLLRAVDGSLRKVS